MLRGQRKQDRGSEKIVVKKEGSWVKKKGLRGSEKKDRGSKRKGWRSKKKGRGSKRKGCGGQPWVKEEGLRGSKQKDRGSEKMVCGQKETLWVKKRRVGGQKERVAGVRKKGPWVKEEGLQGSKQKDRGQKKRVGGQKRRVVGQKEGLAVRKEWLRVKKQWLWVKNKRSRVKLNCCGGQKKRDDEIIGSHGQHRYSDEEERDAEGERIRFLSVERARGCMRSRNTGCGSNKQFCGVEDNSAVGRKKKLGGQKERFVGQKEKIAGVKRKRRRVKKKGLRGSKKNGPWVKKRIGHGMLGGQKRRVAGQKRMVGGQKRMFAGQKRMVVGQKQRVEGQIKRSRGVRKKEGIKKKGAWVKKRGAPFFVQGGLSVLRSRYLFLVEYFGNRRETSLIFGFHEKSNHCSKQTCIGFISKFLNLFFNKLSQVTTMWFIHIALNRMACWPAEDWNAPLPKWCGLPVQQLLW